VAGENQGGVALRNSDASDVGLPLVPGRSCGTCSLCCYVYSVPELNKPAGHWCIHSKLGLGCGIHAIRPPACSQFLCTWLIDPNLGPEWKPEVSRFVLSADPAYRALTLMVDPKKPFAWKREPYYSALKKFSAVLFRINQKVLVNLSGHITVILPDRDVPVGVILPSEEIVIWREGSTHYARLRRDLDLAKTTSGDLRSASM
jgi:hypothetical protein